MCAANKWSCTVAVCRHELVSLLLFKYSLRQHKVTAIAQVYQALSQVLVVYAGCSLFLYCLLKYKLQAINPENIVYNGSSLVSVTQDGS